RTAGRNGMTGHDERQRRWRLVLGAQEGEQGGEGAGEQGGGPSEGETASAPGDGGMEASLNLVYGDSHGGDLGQSAPDVARWLGDIRQYFPEEVVQIMQRDALRRMKPRDLINYPELLAEVEPDASLAATLLSL